MAALVSDCDSQSLRRNKNIDSFLQRCECPPPSPSPPSLPPSFPWRCCILIALDCRFSRGWEVWARAEG